MAPITSKEALRKFYDHGYIDGLQRALDIVNGNFDQRTPDDDLTEIIARIVTDIQVAANA